MRKHIPVILLMCFCTLLRAQNNPVIADSARYLSGADKTIRIAVLLPFNTGINAEKLTQASNPKDPLSAKVKLDENGMTSLDFYSGFITAAEQSQYEKLKLQIDVYDIQDEDSVLTDLLLSADLKQADIIVGPLSTPAARRVAEFCKNFRILNIQPFSASKTLTANNPFCIKFTPSIEAHVDAMMQLIADSFPGRKIILYSGKNDKALPMALRADSLLSMSSRLNNITIEHQIIRSGDVDKNGNRINLNSTFSKSKDNILFIASYEETFVQSTLKTLCGKDGTSDILVFGMPTWMQSDLLDMSYLNCVHTHFTDFYQPDSSLEESKSFLIKYEESYHKKPSRSAYLGFDISSYLLNLLSLYGLKIAEHVSSNPYTGNAFKFNFIPVTGYTNGKDPVTNYYENRQMNLYRVEDFKVIGIR